MNATLPSTRPVIINPFFAQPRRAGIVCQGARLSPEPRSVETANRAAGRTLSPPANECQRRIRFGYYWFLILENTVFAITAECDIRSTRGSESNAGQDWVRANPREQ